MSRPEFCLDHAFDGQVLGRPVWSLTDPIYAGQAIDAALRAGVGLVFHRGPVDAAPPLEAQGFRWVETLVTFEAHLPSDSCAMPEGIRKAETEDADCVGEIAGAVFRNSRWHVDPEIPDDRANEFKRLWARNNVTGRAEVTLLSLDPTGVPVGFNALLVRDGVLIVDLIGVAAVAQGQGHGRRLMQAALSYGAGRYRKLEVGTQATNTASCRLYASLGMQEIRRRMTWHWTPVG